MIMKLFFNSTTNNFDEKLHTSSIRAKGQIHPYLSSCLSYLGFPNQHVLRITEFSGRIKNAMGAT